MRTAPIHSEEIHRTNVTGTPVTVTVTREVRPIPLRPIYVTTREPNGASFVNYLSCGRSTEEEAMREAAFLVADTEKRSPVTYGTCSQCGATCTALLGAIGSGVCAEGCATRCDCSEETGPCELHAEYLVTREGASLRTADELCLLFLADAESIDPSAIDADTRALVAECTADLDANADAHLSAWLSDPELADALRDAVHAVESRLDALTYWEDGYVILRVTGGPLADL